MVPPGLANQPHQKNSFGGACTTPPCEGAERLGDEKRALELIFLVEEVSTGFAAYALGESIFAAGATAEDLRESIREAVRLRFDGEPLPERVRLHFVRDEMLDLGAPAPLAKRCEP